jgi:DNA-binding winged helix-turn-helix (wHTH) protein
MAHRNTELTVSTACHRIHKDSRTVQNSVHVADHRFGDFRLNAEKILWYADTIVPLSPMQRRLRGCFCDRPQQVLTKATLMLGVWGHLEVSEVSLARTVHGLRRRLADAGARGELIRNVYGEGYIFTADVEEIDGSLDTMPMGLACTEAIAV